MNTTSRSRLVPLLGAAAVLTIAVSGCSRPGATSAARPQMVQPVRNSDQTEDAIALLNNGHLKGAKKLLKAMAKRDPNDHRTATLLADLTLDPTKALGERSFQYRVQAGDHMTSLAQHFLGDRLKFFLLARYNNIAIPASIAAGQMLRIPGTAPSVIIAPPVPHPARPEPHPSISASAAPPKPASSPKPTKSPALALRLRGAGLAALNQGQVDRAVALLSRAADLDSANAVIKADLARAMRIQSTVRGRH